MKMKVDELIERLSIIEKYLLDVSNGQDAEYEYAEAIHRTLAALREQQERIAELEKQHIPTQMAHKLILTERQRDAALELAEYWYNQGLFYREQTEGSPISEQSYRNWKALGPDTAKRIRGMK